MNSYLINSKIVCPDRNVDYPVLVKGKGAKLFDEKGKAYIDMAGGKAAVANIGHGREALGAIFMEQVGQFSILPTQYFKSFELENYLQKLAGFTPEGFSKSWTISSGTEAVENAIKFSIQYHQLKGEKDRYKILGRWGSYHGNSMFALDVGGMAIRRNDFMPLLQNFRHAPEAYCYRCPMGLNSEHCDTACARALESVILAEDPSKVAAFIIEPVVGAALGAVPAPEGYLNIIREICDKYGILMIADEVMTGFGRTGANFGIENWNITPDIIVMGKGMGSGYYPLSGITVHDDIMDIFETTNTPFFGGHTYSCNPLGARIGSYVLDVIEEENLVQKSLENGIYFLQLLSRLTELPIVGDVRGQGLMTGIEIVQNKETKEPFPADLNMNKIISELALERGVVLYPGQGSAGKGTGDHILMTPPLVISKDELEEVAEVLYRTLSDVTDTYLIQSVDAI